MLVSLKELMADAEEKGYAVGAFNAVSFESLRAIIAAAEETGKGVILNHAEVHFPIMPLEVIAPIMVDMAKKAKVPVCVHLDHGNSLETCMKAKKLQEICAHPNDITRNLLCQDKITSFL